LSNVDAELATNSAEISKIVLQNLAEQIIDFLAKQYLETWKPASKASTQQDTFPYLSSYINSLISKEILVIQILIRRTHPRSEGLSNCTMETWT
jgi:hypothetical protein